MTPLLGTRRASTDVEGGVASHPQRLERPGRQLLRSGRKDPLLGRGSRSPLSQAAANAVRLVPGMRRSRAAEGAEPDRAAKTASDQAGSAAAGAGSVAGAGQRASAEAAGAGAAAQAQSAKEAAAAEAGNPAPAVGAARAERHSPGAAAAEAELQAEVTWPIGTRVDGCMAAGAADGMDASPIPGSEIALPSLEADEMETMAASNRVLWATALRTCRERIRAAAAAQQLARRQAGNTQQGAGSEGLQVADMPQADRRLAERRDAVNRERSAAAPEAGQTLSAGPQTSSGGRSAVPGADVSAGTSPQTSPHPSIPERSGADEVGLPRGVRRGCSAAEAGRAQGRSRGRSAASRDSGRSQGVCKPASNRGHAAAPLERSWSQRGRLQASSRRRGHSTAPGVDLSQGEMASIVEALGANSIVLASSPPASPWQSGQGLLSLTQADLDADRRGPGRAGQLNDQEVTSADLPRSSPAADSLAAADAAAAARAAGREADAPASLQDLDWHFEPFMARRSKVSSTFAAASKAGQPGNAVIPDTEAAAQAAAKKSPCVSDTTEAAPEALSDPDATQPTSPAPPHSQAPRSAAQSGGSQDVPGATTSGPWGSFGTTGSSHSEKSAAQEDAEGTTATSKVR